MQHPGDDLHVAMWVGLETGAWLHVVVVVDQQQTVVGVRVVVVRAERERVLRVEPGDLCREAIVRPPDIKSGFHARLNHVAAMHVPVHARGGPPVGQAPSAISVAQTKSSTRKASTSNRGCPLVAWFVSTSVCVPVPPLVGA